MGSIYPTKVDWWIALLIFLPVVVLLGTAAQLFIGPQAQGPFDPAFGAVCVLLALWTGWLPFNTNYEITTSELVIRSAGFRWRLALDSIVEVYPTYNPLSSPALSLDRLHINYHNRKGRVKFVMISPREKEAFLRELAEATPGLALADGRLKRANKTVTD